MGNDAPLAGTIPTRARRLAAVASALAAACLVASCSKDNEADARPRRTTTTERAATTTTLNPEEAEKQAVIAAYNAAVQARIDSSAAPGPDPSYPGLAETHTGFMLDYWIATLTGLRDGGTAFQLPENSQFRTEVEAVSFEEMEGERVAYLEVCTVDDTEQVVTSTAGVVTSGVFTIQTTEAMKQVEGAWKLAERRQNTTLEGVAGCAVE